LLLIISSPFRVSGNMVHGKHHTGGVTEATCLKSNRKGGAMKDEEGETKERKAPITDEIEKAV
jgi:hypothetical protein